MRGRFERFAAAGPQPAVAVDKGANRSAEGALVGGRDRQGNFQGAGAWHQPQRGAIGDSSTRHRAAVALRRGGRAAPEERGTQQSGGGPRPENRPTQKRPSERPPPPPG